MPLKCVQSITNQTTIPLYVRASHQLDEGYQNIRLVSEDSLPTTPTSIQPSHITNELQIQTVTQDVHRNEFVSEFVTLIV